MASDPKNVMEKIQLRYSNLGAYQHGRLMSVGLGIANPYAQMALPAVPVVHPYTPRGDERSELGTPCFSLAVKCGGAASNNLPVGAEDLLKKFGVTLDRVDLCILVQNRPWTDSPLEFRPHPWSHSAAPAVGAAYSSTSKVNVAFIPLSGSFREVQEETVVTHGSPKDAGYEQVVFSPDNMPIPHNLLSSPYSASTPSQGFYSFCHDQTTGRVAVTLHYVLNDKDQAEFQAIVDSYRDKKNIGESMTLAILQAQMVGKEKSSLKEMGSALGEFIYGGSAAAFAVKSLTVDLKVALEPQFFAAVKRNDLKMVSGMITGVLIQNRHLNVDLIHEGETALTYALKQGFLDIAQCLIERGANVNTCNSFGEFPLDIAVNKNHGELVKSLQTRGAKGAVKVPAVPEVDLKVALEPQFFAAVKRNDLQIVLGMITGRLIENRYLNVDLVHEGETALTYALKQGFLDIAQCLTERGANVNTCNSSEESPLAIAVDKNVSDKRYDGLVESLQSRGAKPAAKPKNR